LAIRAVRDISVVIQNPYLTFNEIV
jgi:hypothetical protein